MSNYKSDVVLIVADDEHVWFKVVHWPEAVLWRRLTADGAAPHHEGASTFWCRTVGPLCVKVTKVPGMHHRTTPFPSMKGMNDNL